MQHISKQSHHKGFRPSNCCVVAYAALWQKIGKPLFYTNEERD